MPTITIDGHVFEVYSDLAMAEVYALGAIHAEDWRDSDDLTKEMGLVTATRIFERQKWVGVKTDPDQPLEWPRTNVRNIDPDTIPQRVLEANIEVAIALVAGSDLQDTQNQAQKIQNLRAGSVSISYFRGAEGEPIRFPVIIDELLKGLLAGDGLVFPGVLASGTKGKSATRRTFKLSGSW